MSDAEIEFYDLATDPSEVANLVGKLHCRAAAIRSMINKELGWEVGFAEALGDEPR